MKRVLVSGGVAVSVVVALAAAVVVGMIAGAGGVATGDTADSSPSQSPTATPVAAPVAPSPAATPGATPSASPPVALFVGDSYSVGQGATSPDGRWTTRVADRMGWAERNVSHRGTGYVSARPARGWLSYAEQLRGASPDGVDVVVIAGGQNDFPELADEPAAVFAAVEQVFALADRRFADAQIVAVGPSTPWVVGLEARALDSAVRAAAQRHEAAFVSLLDPDVVRRAVVTDDGVHVTDEGHAAIARQVVEQIS